MINDDEPKRKTLVERAGEPARPNTTFAPGRSVVKGTSLTSARSTSMASSTSSRAQSSSSRNTSASSFASSVGPGPRPQSSYGGRPQTSMSRTRSNTATSKRPATAMDDHLDPGGGPATGKRQGRTQHSHTSSLPSHYGYHQLQYHKTRRAPPQFESHGPSSREVSVSTALSRLRLEDHEAESLLPDATNPYRWDVRGRIEDMEAMYFELKDTMADTNVERRSLEEAVRHYKIKLMQLESKNSALEAKKTALESQNTIYDSKIASQQAELDAARQRTHTMMTAADDDRRSHRIELDDAIHNHRRELDQLRRDMTEEMDRLKKTHQRTTDDEFERLDKAHRDEIRELERRNALHLEEEERRRVQDLHEVKMQITLEQQNLDLAVGNKDREIHNMREQIEKVKAELDQEQTSKAILQKSFNDSSSSVVNLEGTVRSLRDRIQFLESGSQAQSDRFELMEKQLQDALEEAKESKSKLTKEETLRRILFNQVQELKGNIRVMCRVRPTGQSEEVAKIMYPDLDKESKELELMGPEEKSSLGTITRKTNAFTFDRTFGPSTTNEEVFGEISQLVQSALDGYNVCIFCYGQTGAGKTHTMSSADGMIPRATHMIYEKATDLQDKGWTYSMEGSFVEVYNEEIHDLLGNPREFDKVKHEIRHDDKKKQTTVTNLKSVELDSPDAVESILKRADTNRSVAATKSNERSSRSHSVFILKLLGRNSTTGETSEGTLNLVDLAGSERLKQSGAEGDRMKETQNINKSLSCLGDVIGALGQGKEGGHIPYRNSKLTYLLQYSLGGNSKTLM
ncbi:kinesin-like nuclear fusion protein [Pseudogymnoascus australis]